VPSKKYGSSRSNSNKSERPRKSPSENTEKFQAAIDRFKKGIREQSADGDAPPPPKRVKVRHPDRSNQADPQKGRDAVVDQSSKDKNLHKYRQLTPADVQLPKVRGLISFTVM
jgi:hypothetical protein